MYTREKKLQYIFIKYTVQHDSDSTATIIRGIHLDITDRKELENELLTSNREQEENKKLLSSVVDNSTALIYIKDMEGKYVLINKGLKNALHFDETEIIGKTDFELYTKDQAEVIRINDRKVINTKAA